MKKKKRKKDWAHSIHARKTQQEKETQNKHRANTENRQSLNKIKKI